MVELNDAIQNTYQNKSNVLNVLPWYGVSFSNISSNLNIYTAYIQFTPYFNSSLHKLFVPLF